MSNSGNHGHDSCGFCGGTDGYHVDEYHGYSNGSSKGSNDKWLIFLVVGFVFIVLSKIFPALDILALFLIPVIVFLL